MGPSRITHAEFLRAAALALLAASQVPRASGAAVRHLTGTVLSWNPRLVAYENFLTDEEVALLRREAENQTFMRTALIGKDGFFVKGTTITSRIANMPHSRTAFKVRRRIADTSQLPVEFQEPQRVLRYNSSDFFRGHLDAHALSGRFSSTRTATFFIYLNDVAEGGETHFPLAVPVADAAKGRSFVRVGPAGPHCAHLTSKETSQGMVSTEYIDGYDLLEGRGSRLQPPVAQRGLSIVPRKGLAVLWHSRRPDGQIDPSSQHVGCPVSKVDPSADNRFKYSLTTWIHFEPPSWNLLEDVPMDNHGAAFFSLGRPRGRPRGMATIRGPSNVLSQPQVFDQSLIGGWVGHQGSSFVQEESHRTDVAHAAHESAAGEAGQNSTSQQDDRAIDAVAEKLRGATTRLDAASELLVDAMSHLPAGERRALEASAHTTQVAHVGEHHKQVEATRESGQHHATHVASQAHSPRAARAASHSHQAAQPAHHEADPRHAGAGGAARPSTQVVASVAAQPAALAARSAADTPTKTPRLRGAGGGAPLQAAPRDDGAAPKPPPAPGGGDHALSELELDLAMARQLRSDMTTEAELLRKQLDLRGTESKRPAAGRPQAQAVAVPNPKEQYETMSHFLSAATLQTETAGGPDITNLVEAKEQLLSAVTGRRDTGAAGSDATSSLEAMSHFMDQVADRYKAGVANRPVHRPARSREAASQASSSPSSAGGARHQELSRSRRKQQSRGAAPKQAAPHHRRDRRKGSSRRRPSSASAARRRRPGRWDRLSALANPAAASACVDITPAGQQKWHDADGPQYDCFFYSHGTTCVDYGHRFASFNMTARDACCACGGGRMPASLAAYAANITVQAKMSDLRAENEVLWKELQQRLDDALEREGSLKAELKHAEDREWSLQENLDLTVREFEDAIQEIAELRSEVRHLKEELALDFTPNATGSAGADANASDDWDDLDLNDWRPCPGWHNSTCAIHWSPSPDIWIGLYNFRVGAAATGNATNAVNATVATGAASFVMIGNSTY